MTNSGDKDVEHGAIHNQKGIANRNLQPFLHDQGNGFEYRRFAELSAQELDPKSF